MCNKTGQAYAVRPVRIAYVIVLGRIWMPMATASLRINLRDYDLENIGDFTRENVEEWLTANAGDFSQVLDFTAACGDIEIPWGSEESEIEYLDTITEDE